jgi:hypothetical protein
MTVDVNRPGKACPLAIWAYNRLKEESPADQLAVWLHLKSRLDNEYTERQRLSIAALNAYSADQDQAASWGLYEGWQRAPERAGQWPSPVFIANSFGSWNKALQAQGVRPAPDAKAVALLSTGSAYEREEVLRCLRRYRKVKNTRDISLDKLRSWAKEELADPESPLKRIPTSQNTHKKLFGSWPAAARAAGLVPGDEQGRHGGSMDDYAPESILGWLKRWEESQPKRMTAAVFDVFAQQQEDEAAERGESVVVPRAARMTKEFGCFPKALLDAGLIDEIEYRRRLRKAGGHASLCDEAVFELVLEFIDSHVDELRRGPYDAWIDELIVEGERDPRELPSSGVLRVRWGSMKGAGEEALAYRARKAFAQREAA